MAPSEIRRLYADKFDYPLRPVFDRKSLSTAGSGEMQEGPPSCQNTVISCAKNKQAISGLNVTL